MLIFHLNTEPIPRYVRVNTNLFSIAAALEYLADKNWRRKELDADISYTDFLSAVRTLEEDEFLMDLHVEGVLIFHHKSRNFWPCHDLVVSKRFILQNKGTCLAAELLAPPPGAIVLDMCAAPGMKTLHICNVMKNNGRIYSVEQARDRYKALCDVTEEAGCQIVTPLFADVLTIGKQSTLSKNINC